MWQTHIEWLESNLACDFAVHVGREPLERICRLDVSVAGPMDMIRQRVRGRDLCLHPRDRKSRSVLNYCALLTSAVVIMKFRYQLKGMICLFFVRIPPLQTHQPLLTQLTRLRPSHPHPLVPANHRRVIMKTANLKAAEARLAGAWLIAVAV